MCEVIRSARDSAERMDFGEGWGVCGASTRRQHRVGLFSSGSSSEQLPWMKGWSGRKDVSLIYAYHTCLLHFLLLNTCVREDVVATSVFSPSTSCALLEC